MMDDMIVVPASATVYLQAAECRTTKVCGVDVSAGNRYRWTPACTAGVGGELRAGAEVFVHALASPGHCSCLKDLKSCTPTTVQHVCKVHDCMSCTCPYFVIPDFADRSHTSRAQLYA